MKIEYQSELLFLPVENIISFITDRAKICIEDVHYYETKSIVEIYMLRKELIEVKKSLFGELKPIYSQIQMKSLLTIRQVENMNLEVDDRLKSTCNSCFTILFGVRFEKKQLFLGSIEEIQGKTLCQILIKVKKFDIEIRDIV